MDNRIFERFLSAAGIALSKSNGQFLCNGTIMNISKGGMLVTFLDAGVLEGLKKNEKIKFEVKLQHGSIIGECQIVWINTDESHVGLKFTKVEHESGIVNLMDFASGSISKVFSS